MTAISIASAGQRLLSRFGLAPDPLIVWMERTWRLTPNAAGAMVWKGRFAGFPLRLWTGGGDDAYRSTNGRYRIGLGEVPPRPGFRFMRNSAAKPGELLIRVGGGFVLDPDLDADHPSLLRIGEITAHVRECSKTVDQIVLGDGGVQIEVVAAAATPATLADDISRAAAILRLDRVPAHDGNWRVPRRRHDPGRGPQPPAPPMRADRDGRTALIPDLSVSLRG